MQRREWNFSLKETLKEIPHAPGVYIFKDENKQVLYVGKAKDLKNRLSSYERNAYLYPKISALLERTAFLEYIITRTEKEALLLEANLIKQYRPKYNVVLKDDKNYPLLRLSLKEEYPALQIVRKRKKGDNSLYFGPFTSARALKETLKLLSSLFPLRKCSLAEMKRRKTPCVYYQIKKCLGPCVNKVSKAEYKKLVEGVCEFFQGKGRELIEKLRKEIEECVNNLEFERAAFLRDRIRDIELILEKQAIVLDKQIDLDFWFILNHNEKFYIGVLFIRNGYLLGFQGFQLKKFSKEEEIDSIIIQFYSQGKPIPEFISVSSESGIIFTLKVLEESLSELAGKPVKTYELEEENYKILKDIALKNLQKFIEIEEKTSSIWCETLIEELMRVFRLKKEPRRIEAIDLSQYYGNARVGGLVCYIEGIPEKDFYRRYKIKSEDAKDDYSMLYEVVFRRLKRGKEENNLPDLLLIDGGKGHLQVALRVCEDLELLQEIDVVSVAKNEKHLPEKVYLPNRKNPLSLKKYPIIYNFIASIMEEAHRFAKEYSVLYKSKKDLEDIFTQIKGIGEKRRKILLERFNSIEEIKKADISEIARLPGFNQKIAKTLKKALNSAVP